MKVNVTLTVIFMMIITSSLHAQTIEEKAKALQLITQTAKEICDNIVFEGNSTKIQAEGEIGAGVSDLVRKLIDLGVSGEMQIDSETYTNITQDKLAELVIDNPNVVDQSACRTHIFESLKDDILPGSTSNTLPPLGDAQYRNDYLLAKAMSASQSESGEYITIALQIENISKETIALAYNSNFSQEAIAIDNYGNKFRESSMSGLISLDKNPVNQEKFAKFPPNSRHNVVFEFRRKKSSKKADLVSFSSNLYLGSESGSIENLSLGISNIVMNQ